jgi:type I restriction enzyme, S subunit
MSAAGTVGKTYLHNTHEPACYAGYLVRFRPRCDVDSRFISYWAQTSLFIGQIEMGKVTSTIDNFAAGKYQNLRVMIPSFEEQKAIADYLDAETARIDALIAKKQRLIELLELQFLERCRAMTTPLDAPVAPLRWTAAVRTGTTPSAEASWMMSDDGSVEWFTPGDVGARLTLHPSARRLDPVALSSREVPAFPARSTLLVGIGATAGKVAFMSRAGSSNQQMTAVVPGERLEPRFLAWQLWARGGEMRATAPYTTLPILNNDFVKSFQICVPTLEAQHEIVDCVDRLDRLTTALTRKLGRQTRLLAEHRQAMITSAVAGSLAVAKSGQAELTGSR